MAAQYQGRENGRQNLGGTPQYPTVQRFRSTFFYTFKDLVNYVRHLRKDLF
jgi:hypothetical protein